jgi:hypothetical protein
LLVKDGVGWGKEVGAKYDHSETSIGIFQYIPSTPHQQACSRRKYSCFSSNLKRKCIFFKN